jgi:hypothetical protein
MISSFGTLWQRVDGLEELSFHRMNPDVVSMGCKKSADWVSNMPGFSAEINQSSEKRGFSFIFPKKSQL